jgi:hypothetical protein
MAPTSKNLAEAKMRFENIGAKALLTVAIAWVGSASESLTWSMGQDDTPVAYPTLQCGLNQAL